jgi:hypothetical protein
MRFKQILLEYNRDRTLQVWGEKVKNAMLHDMASHGDALTHGIPDFVMSKGDKAEIWALNYFEKIDPTKKKAFVPALARWYGTRSMRSIEDARKAIPAILTIQKFKNRLVGFDPMNVTFDQFLDKADELEGVKSKTEIAKDEENAFYASGQAVLFHDDADFKIIRIKSKAAAEYFGKGTRWCTTSENGDMYSHYASQGDLFIIILREDHEKWQFHFQTMQFMDSKDNEISKNGPTFREVMLLFADYIVKELFEPLFKEDNGTPKSFFKGIGQLLQYLPQQSDEFYKQCLTHIMDIFKYIKNPSEEVCRMGIEVHPDNIGFVKNPSEELQEIAINENPFSIDWIANASPRIQMIAVQKNPLSFHYIENPDPTVEAMAVKLDPTNIEYVNNPPEEMQMQVISRKPDLIGRLRNPCEKAILFAVSERGYYIGSIVGKFRTPPVQIAAVTQNPQSIKYIENPCEQAMLVSVMADGNNISLIDDASQTLKVQLAAIKQNTDSARLIKDPKSIEVQRYKDAAEEEYWA